MMVNIKSKEQIYALGCEPWRNMYSDKKLSLLENSWAGVFRRYILPNLPAKEIAKHYSSTLGRKTKELFSITGVVALQEFFDTTDEETIERLAFDQQWHYALECFDEKDQIISFKTLWTMRKIIVKGNLADDIFNLSTDEMIKAMGIDVSKQRLDSVHVHSNMARLGRIRIFVRAIISFLKNLKRHHKALYDSFISQEMIEKYLKKDTDSCFSQLKPSDRERNLQGLADDTYSLILAFQNAETVPHMSTFKLLVRIFNEHCTVEGNDVIVKKSKDVPSDSVQNPSDPDAGYDGHKGQGYQTQIAETYKTDEDRAGVDGNKPDIITYAETESADKQDAYALEPAVKDISERGHNCQELTADTSYGGSKNVQIAKELGIELIAPIPGNKSSRGHELFEFDYNNYEVTACLAGKKPDKLKHNKALSITAIWYEDTCKDCPFAKDCPTKKCKNGRSHYYKIDSIKCYFRREYEKSKEFMDTYRFRSGIEATISRFILMTSARRSRYRGLEKMRFSQKLKALAINMFRITRYLQSIGILIKLSDFIASFFVFSGLRKQNYEFAA
ncbi:MAG: transposase [Thermodesulfobacteriota bacterium]|nr:transposase [Thermodesulfobacteriota bacterium]